MSDVGKATLRLVSDIFDEGVTHVSILMRHSAREYDRTRPDAENQLTDEGRALALELGHSLPKEVTLRGYASPVERCQETVRLILEGHESKDGNVTRYRTIEALGSFYVLDRAKLGRALQAAGDWRAFYTNWLAGRLDPDVLMASPLAAQVLAEVTASKLNSPVSLPQLDVLVSHDMNLYPVRQHLLEQSISEVGGVAYLDAVAFYEKDGALRARSHHGEEKSISI